MLRCVCTVEAAVAVCDVCGGSCGHPMHLCSRTSGIPSGVELASLPILHLHTQLSAHSIAHQPEHLFLGTFQIFLTPESITHLTQVRDGGASVRCPRIHVRQPT